MNARPDSTWKADAFFDASWAMQFEPQVLENVWRFFVNESSPSEDRSEGIDWKVRGARIASRGRRMSAAGAYRDVTIRSRRRSGVKTELDKLHNVDIYLYFWVSDATGKVVSRLMFDVRKAIDADVFSGREEKWNRDGGSAFIAVPIADLQAADAVMLYEPVVLKPLPAKPDCIHALHWPGGTWKQFGDRVLCSKCGRFYGRLRTTKLKGSV